MNTITVKTNQNLLEFITGLQCPACKKHNDELLAGREINQGEYEDYMIESQIIFFENKLVCNNCEEVPEMKIKLTLELIKENEKE